MITAKQNKEIFYFSTDLKNVILSHLNPKIEFDRIILNLEESLKCRIVITPAKYPKFALNNLEEENLSLDLSLKGICTGSMHYAISNNTDQYATTKVYSSVFNQEEFLKLLDKHSDKIELLFTPENMVQKFNYDFDESSQEKFKKNNNLYNGVVKDYAFASAVTALLSICGVSDSFREINNKMLFIDNKLKTKGGDEYELLTFKNCRVRMCDIVENWNTQFDIKGYEFKNRVVTVDDVLSLIKLAYELLSQYILAYTEPNTPIK